MSGVLVDTHIALWALGDPGRLSEVERAVLVDPSIDRRLSPVSIWEAAIKREAGRLRAPRGNRVIRGLSIGELKKASTRQPEDIRHQPPGVADRGVAGRDDLV